MSHFIRVIQLTREIHVVSSLWTNHSVQNTICLTTGWEIGLNILLVTKLVKPTYKNHTTGSINTTWRRLGTFFDYRRPYNLTESCIIGLVCFFSPTSMSNSMSNLSSKWNKTSNWMITVNIYPGLNVANSKQRLSDTKLIEPNSLLLILLH